MSVLISPLKGAKVDDSTATLSLSSALRPRGRAAPDAVVAAFWAQGSDAPAALGKETRAMGVANSGLQQGPFPLLLHRHTASYSQFTVGSPVPTLRQEPERRPLYSTNCWTRARSKGWGKPTKVSIFGHDCSHGTGMQAVTWQELWKPLLSSRFLLFFLSFFLSLNKPKLTERALLNSIRFCGFCVLETLLFSIATAPPSPRVPLCMPPVHPSNHSGTAQHTSQSWDGSGLHQVNTAARVIDVGFLQGSQESIVCFWV